MRWDAGTEQVWDAGALKPVTRNYIPTYCKILLGAPDPEGTRTGSTKSIYTRSTRLRFCTNLVYTAAGSKQMSLLKRNGSVHTAAGKAWREGESDEQDQVWEGELGGKQQSEIREKKKKWKSKHMFLTAAFG